MSATLDLAIDLIERPSVTPRDAGCQTLIAGRLAALGFTLEHLRFGEVDNLWATRGRQRPLLAFAGHTDVVPPGPIDAWHSDPFEPELRDGLLYGRGAADMKGSIASMVTAAERFVAVHPHHVGTIALLITSDEEGPAVDGTAKVVETLRSRGAAIDWCLVGEPSSEQRLGDVIKNGRRGSLNASLAVKGVQGHVAYPARARNPIHLALPALQELCSTTWDAGDDSFPPTSFQISNVRAGTGADNVIPGVLEVLCNFRYSTASIPAQLQARVAAALGRHGLDYACEWRSSGQPFLSKSGKLLGAVRRAIREERGIETRPATTGGTSDGRFIAPAGAEVIELGPVNATIHMVNECVAAADLDGLSRIYERVLSLLLL